MSLLQHSVMLWHSTSRLHEYKCSATTLSCKRVQDEYQAAQLTLTTVSLLVVLRLI